MSTSPSPHRPPIKQTRSTGGWGWPRLADKKEQQQQQQEKAASSPHQDKGKKTNGAAAPSSLRYPQSSSSNNNDLPSLREEEQSPPTSPTTHMPSTHHTQRDSMNGHRAEELDNANPVDDQSQSQPQPQPQPESVDFESKGEKMPEGSGQLSEDQHGEHDVERIGNNRQAAQKVDDKDAVHPDGGSLPGTFPLTPAAAESVGDRFPGLAQAGLLPASAKPLKAVEPNTKSKEAHG